MSVERSWKGCAFSTLKKVKTRNSGFINTGRVRVIQGPAERSPNGQRHDAQIMRDSGQGIWLVAFQLSRWYHSGRQDDGFAGFCATAPGWVLRRPKFVGLGGLSMSLSDVASLKCPSCGKKQEVEVWTSINVTNDPGLRERLFSGDINLLIAASAANRPELTAHCSTMTWFAASAFNTTPQIASMTPSSSGVSIPMAHVLQRSMFRKGVVLRGNSPLIVKTGVEPAPPWRGTPRLGACRPRRLDLQPAEEQDGSPSIGPRLA